MHSRSWIVARGNTATLGCAVFEIYRDPIVRKLRKPQNQEWLCYFFHNQSSTTPDPRPARDGVFGFCSGRKAGPHQGGL